MVAIMEPKLIAIRTEIKTIMVISYVLNAIFLFVFIKLLITCAKWTLVYFWPKRKERKLI